VVAVKRGTIQTSVGRWRRSGFSEFDGKFCHGCNRTHRVGAQLGMTD